MDSNTTDVQVYDNAGSGIKISTQSQYVVATGGLGSLPAGQAVLQLNSLTTAPTSDTEVIPVKVVYTSCGSSNQQYTLSPEANGSNPTVVTVPATQASENACTGANKGSVKTSIGPTGSYNALGGDYTGRLTETFTLATP